jgi:hypothetical protein
LEETFNRFTHDNFKEKEMADFRKMLFAFAGLVTLISTASAQNSNPLTCTAFVANQPIMRQEGQTEPAGDIIIQCSGLLAGAQTGSQTLSLYVAGAAITSRTLNGTASTTNGTPTEAALLVNDNPLTAVQGNLQNGALVFSNFFLPNSPTGLQFQVRVTNVRVNANSLAAGSFVTGTVLATFPVQNQSGLVLGAVQASLSVSVTTPPANFAQCTSTATSGSTITNIKVSELVNTAFKAPASCSGVAATGCTVNISNSTPGQWYQNGLNTESQTVLPTNISGWVNNIGATPGQADAATRIRINFSNVPAGVTISVPVTIQVNSSSILNATASDVGSFSIVSGSTVSLTSAGSVTYEVRAQQGGLIDSFSIPTTITYTYTPPSTPNVGSVLVSATYAPTSAETTTAVPRFADTSVLTPLFTIAACQTDLLFTFLTNQAGFDTGFEIANTSADPFGTAAQAGNCTLNWYGTGPAAGTATTTPSVAAGSYYVNLVSTAAAGFQGYMIAVCNFQYGHGFAFISDGYGQPGKGLSQGYLASVIPTPALNGAVRAASDASRAAVNSSEALNQ